MAANIRLLRRRIKTAKNISQITKAMEMVAASKMRRAQEQTLAGRPYAQKLRFMAQNLIGRLDEADHPYLIEKKQGKTLLLLFSSDKGLAGSYNTNILREFLKFSRERRDTEVISIGKKLEKAVVRSGGVLLAEFPFGTSLPSFDSILPVTDILIDGYMRGAYKQALVLYTHFVSMSVQKPVTMQLLPVTKNFGNEQEVVKRDTYEDKAADGEASGGPYKFEPSAGELLTYLMPHYLEMTLYQIFLESYASEQGARMIAMHQASENAKDVIWELTLTYNKARQERITSELLDITGASFGVVS